MVQQATQGAKWTGYFKFVTPQPSLTKMSDNQETADSGAYNNYTWYQRLIQGSASRMTRYLEYDLMDNDVEVARSLDTIAEEITGNNVRSDEPLDVFLLTAEERNPESTTVLTIRTALRRWFKLHQLDSRLFTTARMAIKYGDCFFRRGKTDWDGWTFVHPKNVIAAIVDDKDLTKIIAWQIKKDIRKPIAGGYGLPLNAKQDTLEETEIVSSKEIIRFTLCDDMSDAQPFGESVLRPVFRAHKQKELLEDAILIYRIQRAPERRVFYIDVGKMPPQRVKTYLEGIKNEIKQKRVPTSNGGQAEVDSVYNPHSMSEDFFFAQRPDGRGSKVETLPGGQGLGELADLEYFQRKVWRGLRIPTSYMMEQDAGGAMFNDGKVGMAYIQELRFALFISRLQVQLEKTLDYEFKRFISSSNVKIDEELYEIRLPEPSNFGKYRQLELDTQLLGAYASADGVAHLSKRFALKRYLQLTDEDVITNERLKAEELGLDPDDGKENYSQIYASEAAGGEMGGMGGGFMGGGMEGGMGGMEGEAGAEGGEMGGAGAAPAGGAGGGGAAL
jgi:hypothetical protein